MPDPIGAHVDHNDEEDDDNDEVDENDIHQHIQAEDNENNLWWNFNCFVIVQNNFAK